MVGVLEGILEGLGGTRRIRRSAHVVVKRRGSGRDHRAGGHAVCAQTKACYRWRAFGQGAPPCLGTIFISPTGRKAWIIQKGWTCRATPPRVRRQRWWRGNSDPAKP